MQKQIIYFDIGIVGAGHAGCEAAYISSLLGKKVSLFTLPDVQIASMPCNPSIGGVGKGQLVREIDSLGGLMGRIADRNAIQYRILNEGKGFAVQSTRCQIDKDSYSRDIKSELENCENIEIIYKEVHNIEKVGGGFLLNTDGQNYFCKKIIVTTGTFLDGLTHIGNESHSGGRYNVSNSKCAELIFKNINIKKRRFKTGTPPRLKYGSVNFKTMIEQKSDEATICLSVTHRSDARFKSQVSCFLTRSNINTSKVISENKNSSPLFNGQINGIGPRYCPSIEDKIYRYPDRSEHHIFIEPEGLDEQTVYPNGISTSLPKQIQEKFVRTISGLEDVEFESYGYAVEYDVIDSSLLSESLEYSQESGLYFAGQVNGTSGYEEAAAQGLIAGINASKALDNLDPFVMDRFDSYIGVLISDIVTKKLDEPYRLFTARSENRFFIRDDNAFIRMFDYRKKLNLSHEIDTVLENLQFQYNLLRKYCDNFKVSNETTLSDYLKRGDVNPVVALRDKLSLNNFDIDDKVIRAVAISLKYDGYIKRYNEEYIRHEKFLGRKIEWRELTESTNISFECKKRITENMPKTLNELKAINGIRPATIAYVAGRII